MRDLYGVGLDGYIYIYKKICFDWGGMLRVVGGDVSYFVFLGEGVGSGVCHCLLTFTERILLRIHSIEKILLIMCIM